MDYGRWGLLAGIALLGVACGQTGEESDEADTSITIRDASGAPLEGITAIFHDANGSVARITTSDASGNVTASVPASAKVTLIMKDTEPYELVTFGVQPNGSLVFQQPGAPSPAPVGTVDVSYTAADPIPALYVVDVGCDSATSTNLALPTLNLDTSCLTIGNTFHVQATAYDAAGNLLAVNQQVENDAPTGGGNTTVTLGPWVTNFDTLDWSLTNIPAEATAVGVRDLSLFMDGIAFDMRFENEATPSGGGVYNRGGSILPGMQALAGSWYAKYDGIDGSATSETAMRRYTLDDVPTQIDIDLAIQAPPAPSRYAIEGDPDRPVIVLETVDSLTGDTVVVEANDPHSNWINVYAVGSVLRSNTRLEVMLPELPEEFAAMRPTASAIAPIWLLDFSALAGHADVVSQIGIGPLTTSKIDPVLWVDRLPGVSGGATTGSVTATITYTGLE